MSDRSGDGPPRRQSGGRRTNGDRGGGRGGAGTRGSRPHGSGARGSGDRGATGGAATTVRDPARRAAYDVLCAITTRDAYANLLLPATLTDRGVRGRDAALATELTYGTLRRQGSYDAILDACVDRSLRSVDAEVLPLLRLGAHQLLSTDIPPHAAVSATVDLARRTVGQHRSRFVNAVLRKVSARDLDTWLTAVAPDRAGDPVGHLSVRHSHPRWIVEALAAALGEIAPEADQAPGEVLDEARGTESGEAPSDGLGTAVGKPTAVRPVPAHPTGGTLTETERLLAAHNERPVVTLLAKPGRATADDLRTAGATPARYSPYAGYLPEGDPAALAAVRQGRVAVQDEASQLVALALARVPVAGGETRWLDQCAGPGGKAALLAGLAGERGARLLAAEIRPTRAGLVAGAVARSPGDGARVVAADATRPAWRAEAFDRVLVDAPCTGLGALRRRPEARWRRDPRSLAELVPLQRALLDSALDATRGGGVVAYVTCSPHLAETREVVAAVCAARDDAEPLRAAEHLPEVADAATGPHGEFVQLWPHRHGTDAMFLALLRKG